MTTHRRHVRSAFTLIEILVCIVILGIAATLIIPQMSNASDLQAAAAARVLIADLTYAQNAAITSQKTHYVKFTKGSDTDTYSVIDAVSPAENIVRHPVSQMTFTQKFGVGGVSALSGARIGDIELGTAGATTIAFDSLGSPSSYTSGAPVPLADPGTIDVTCNGFALRIAIEPYTGELSVTSVTP